EEVDERPEEGHEAEQRRRADEPAVADPASRVPERPEGETEPEHTDEQARELDRQPERRRMEEAVHRPEGRQFGGGCRDHAESICPREALGNTDARSYRPAGHAAPPLSSPGSQAAAAPPAVLPHRTVPALRAVRRARDAQGSRVSAQVTCVYRVYEGNELVATGRLVLDALPEAGDAVALN